MKMFKSFSNLIVGLLVCSQLFMSCKEQLPPGLDLGGGGKVSDSSYSTSIETPQQKLVVVEEVTGVQCTNCPSGARLLKSISQQNNNKAIVVAIHATGFAEPDPTYSTQDFRTEDGTQIVNSLGQPGLPAASIDRTPNAQGIIFKSKSAWSPDVVSQLAKTTPFNIHLESTYSSSTNECELVIKTAFTQDVNEDLVLTVYVIEDSIIEYQLDGEQPAGQQNVVNYKHDHVFRDCITNILGTPLNFGEKKAGNVLQKRITFNPIIDGDKKWNLDHCHIVAFVSRVGNSREILHAEEIKLK